MTDTNFTSPDINPNNPKNTTESLPMVITKDYILLARLAGELGEKQWLEDRVRYTTATEAAKLMRSSSPSGRRDYVDGKKEPKKIPANRAMQWGHEREDHILSEASRMSGIAIEHNHQVAVKSDDTRFAATPDGIGDDVVAEAKTFNIKVTDFLPDQYFYQMQWQMFVCNKKQCLYAYEVYEDYKPVVDEETGSSVHYRIIDRDDAVIKAMVSEVELALEQMNEVKESSDQIDDLIFKLAIAQAKTKAAKAEEDKLKNEIKKLTGAGVNEYAYGSAKGKITATYPKPTEKFNFKQFREDHPKIFKKYGEKFVSVSEQNAPTLRVTPSKEVKAEVKDILDELNAKSVETQASENIAAGLPVEKPSPKRSAPKVSF